MEKNEVGRIYNSQEFYINIRKKMKTIRSMNYQT
uniref:Uncharacterized protein n=1 Tax=Anguilla anguilla TaxID=7936 RepID=A0A0E9WJ69_ANGAN